MKVNKGINIFLSLVVFGSFAEAKDLGFRFQSQTGKCVNQAGAEGLNPGFFGQCSDLRRVILAKFNLDDTDFSGSLFDEADLQQTTFNRAVFTNVSFQGSNLAGVEMQKASITSVNFTQANMQNIRLGGSTFLNANLSGVDFTGSQLSYMNFQNCLFDGANFSKAALDNATLSNSSMNKAVFVGANLKSAKMQKVKVNGADFSGANLTQADLSGAQGVGVDFSSSVLRNANMTGGVFSQGKFVAAVLENVKLDSTNLEKSDFKSASLSGATFTGIQIKDALFNKRTTLPFSQEVAKSYGMILKAANLLIIWDIKSASIGVLKKVVENFGIDADYSSNTRTNFTSTKFEDYTAILDINSNSYNKDLPESVQEAIVAFVKRGGTYISTEWTGYQAAQRNELKKMRDLVLFGYNTGDFTKQWMVVETMAKHPFLDGVNGTFPTGVNVASSPAIEFQSNPSSVLIKGDNGTPMVITRSVGSGTVLALAALNNGSDAKIFEYADFQKLILNVLNQ